MWTYVIRLLHAGRSIFAHLAEGTHEKGKIGIGGANDDEPPGQLLELPQPWVACGTRACQPNGDIAQQEMNARPCRNEPSGYREWQGRASITFQEAFDGAWRRADDAHFLDETGARCL